MFPKLITQPCNVVLMLISFTLCFQCLGIMSVSLRVDWNHTPKSSVAIFNITVPIPREHCKEMCDRISWGRFWTHPVTVHEPCRCSAKTLQSPSIYFQSADGMTIPTEGPWISITVIYFPSCTHMSIWCHRIRDARYCSAAWWWCQISYWAFSGR